MDDSPDDFIGRNTIMNHYSNNEDKRVKYIQHKVNLGANAARNTGMSNAVGEYYAFLDDDDIWLNTKLETQIKYFDDPQVGLVYCKAVRYNETVGEFSSDKLEKYNGYVFDKLMYSNFIGSNSFVMISRISVEKVGQFDNNLLSSQDWELFLRIAKEYKVAISEEVLVIYIIHEGERITSDPSKQLQGWEYIMTIHKDYLKHHPKILNYWRYRMIPLYMRNGQFFKSFTVFLKTILNSPIGTIKNLKTTIFKEKKSIIMKNPKTEWRIAMRNTEK